MEKERAGMIEGEGEREREKGREEDRGSEIDRGSRRKGQTKCPSDTGRQRE